MPVLDNPPIPVGHFQTLDNGQRMHFHELGTPSAEKPSILFLHGSGPGASGYSNFHLNFPFFAERGFHVLIPDYLGYGLSDKPSDIEYTSAMHVATLHELLQQRGVSRVVPLGNSMGGAIAFEYALAYPQQVEKLVVMGPGGVEDPALWAGQMSGLRNMAAFIAGKEQGRERFRELLHLIVADPAHITDAVIDSRHSIWLEQPAEVYSTMKVGVYAERFSEIQVPVLCLWGQKDNFLPVRHALVVAESLQHARVVISTASGHWFMFEEPDYFNAEVLGFLEG